MSELLTKAREAVRLLGNSTEPHPENVGQRRFVDTLDAALLLAEREGAVGECGCETCWSRLAEASAAVEELLR